MQFRYPTAVAVLSCVACLAVAQSAHAQTSISNAKFVRMGNGVIVLDDAGTTRTIPIRNTAIVSIRGDVDFAEIPKGAKVVLRGRVDDGSKVVKNWSIVYHPLSRPIAAVSDRTEGSPNGNHWNLNLFCTLVSTDPLKVQALPGNEYSLSVYDPVSRIYGIGAYRGPRMDGMTIELDDANRSRRDTTEIEFGANSQYAGEGATVSVTVGGNPVMAETVFIRRVEPFTVPKGPVKKK
jgi:hypothetical protein